MVAISGHESPEMGGRSGGREQSAGHVLEFLSDESRHPQWIIAALWVSVEVGFVRFADHTCMFVLAYIIHLMISWLVPVSP